LKTRRPPQRRLLLGHDSAMKKLIFIHIPKNAGTSIAKTVGFWVKVPMAGHGSTNHFPDNHPRALRIEKRNPDFIRFAVCRNPYDRALSLFRYFQDKTRVNRGKNMGIRLFRSMMCLLSDDPNYFWQNINIKPLVDTNTIIHFRPQTWFINREDTRILRYENLQADFADLIRDSGRPPMELKYLNRSKTPHEGPWSDFLNERTKRVIRRVYRKDFEHFEYDE